MRSSKTKRDERRHSAELLYKAELKGGKKRVKSTHCLMCDNMENGAGM